MIQHKIQANSNNGFFVQHPPRNLAANQNNFNVIVRIELESRLYCIGLYRRKRNTDRVCFLTVTTD